GETDALVLAVGTDADRRLVLEELGLLADVLDVRALAHEGRLAELADGDDRGRPAEAQRRAAGGAAGRPRRRVHARLSVRGSCSGNPWSARSSDGRRSR